MSKTRAARWTDSRSGAASWLAEENGRILGYARAIPRITAQIRANLQTPLAKPLIDRGIAGFGGFAEFFRKNVAQIFASIQDAQVQKDLAAANEAAAKAA